MNAMGLIGLILSMVALALNANHRRRAQQIFIVGNLMWLAYAVDRQLLEVFISQALYLALNIRTLIAWTREIQRARHDAVILTVGGK